MLLRRVVTQIISVVGVFFLCGFEVGAAEGAKSGVFNVREFGAKGDGAALDTASINQAVEAASKAGGGQVLFPPGRYHSGTVRLQSNVSLYFEPGSVLLGTTNLNEYIQPNPPSNMPEAKWGKWHRGLIVGENIENFSIGGQGIIDGNKVFDPTGEERMRGPHTVVFVNCKGATIRDVTIQDSANYAIFFQVSDNVDLRNLKITGGWDAIHFRGAPDRYCTNVNIIGCQMYTGDDCIAGRYWDNTVIKDCIINSSCNGIRVIGPAKKLIVNNNLFYGPGLHPHRTSREKRRTNMLSGIILQPGAWDATRGPLDDVLISNNTMDNVASPFTLWIKTNNTVGKVTVDGLRATGVYRSAISAESWAETAITNVVLRNVHAEFAGGGTADQGKQAVKGPHVDARPLPAWGFYGRNVKSVTLEDVRFSLASGDFRPVIHADSVDQLTLDNFRYTRVDGVTDPISTNNVGKVKVVE